MLLDEAGPGLAYRVFRDGQVIVERDWRAVVQRKARAILEYLDFRPVERIFTRAVLGARAGVDATIVATKIAAIRDAVARVGQVLPPDAAGLEADRTAREVVVLNLFVALQETVSLATHWLADAGLDVPGSYREIFLVLAGREKSPRHLAERLASAAGDLLEFCGIVSREAAAR